MKNKLIAMWYILLGEPVAYRFYFKDYTPLTGSVIVECYLFYQDQGSPTNKP